MRIAVSGTHASGKTALIHELAARLPEFAVIEEPYHSLHADGYVFSHPPVLEDYERQLQLSLDWCDSHGAVLLDRSPVDFLAYLACVSPGDLTVMTPWLNPVFCALENLDLVVFIALETPDRIDPTRYELPRLRKCVDARLRSFLLEDTLGLSPTVLRVSGSVDDRVAQVLNHLRASI